MCSSSDASMANSGELSSYFTNRETYLNAFSQHLIEFEGTALPVLSLYGVGGIGKTACRCRVLYKYVIRSKHVKPQQTAAFPSLKLPHSYIIKREFNYLVMLMSHTEVII